MYTYIHGNGNNHELCVEADKRLILAQAVLPEQSLVDNSEKVPVEGGVDDEDENLGSTIPVFVDKNESRWCQYMSCVRSHMLKHLRLTDGGVNVRGDEDDKDCNIDACHDGCGSPFQLLNRLSRLGNDSDSIDDDLHEKLCLKDPEEENEKEESDTRDMSVG